MSLPEGTELGATGIVGFALAVWGKYKFVTRSELGQTQAQCQHHLAEKIDSMTHTQQKILDRLDELTKHQGRVEQYMEMKGGG